MTILCTLFGSNYLDKGLTLYQSISDVSSKFRLYILAMDDVCLNALLDLKLQNVEVISLLDFEDDELLKAKSNRTFGEYCWTCSSSLLYYILVNFKHEFCTYIDADLYFYKDPQILIDEFLESKSSVQIIEHRFSKSNKNAEIKFGRFCVEFNTFKNDSYGLNVLLDWKNQCLNCCTTGDGIHWGDQKYQDDWIEKYGDIIYISNNLGAGVAPWNINQYKLDNNNNLLVKKLKKYEIIEMIFYHFENIQYVTRNKININVFKSFNIDKKLVYDLYFSYLKKNEENKKFLEETYRIHTLITHHPGIDTNFNIFKRVFILVNNIFKNPYLMHSEILKRLKHFFFKLMKRNDIIEI